MFNTIVQKSSDFAVLAGQTVIALFAVGLTIRAFIARERNREQLEKQGQVAFPDDAISTTLLYVTAFLVTSTAVWWLHFFEVI